jgi:hypothetical protein
MKNYYFFFLLIFLGWFQLRAQPILNNSIFPSVGTVIKTGIADSLQLSPGNAGANQSWDFSTLKPKANNGVVPLMFIATTGSPAAESFPTANLVGKFFVSDTINVYSYYKASSTDLVFLGTAVVNGKKISSTTSNETLLKVPLSFNGSFSSQSGQVSSNSGITTRSKTQKTLTYDAYGTLKMPNKTIANAVRIKSVVTRKDSTLFTGGGSFMDLTTTTYDWFVNDRANSLLSISSTLGSSKVQLTGLPDQITVLNNFAVTYALDLVTSVGDVKPELPFQVTIIGSNPVLHELQIQLNSDKLIHNAVFMVLDQAGKPLKMQPLELGVGIQTLKTDVSDFPVGTYYAVFKSGNALKTLPFLKL